MKAVKIPSRQLDPDLSRAARAAWAVFVERAEVGDSAEWRELTRYYQEIIEQNIAAYWARGSKREDWSPLPVKRWGADTNLQDVLRSVVDLFRPEAVGVSDTDALIQTGVPEFKLYAFRELHAAFASVDRVPHVVIGPTYAPPVGDDAADCLLLTSYGPADTIFVAGANTVHVNAPFYSAELLKRYISEGPHFGVGLAQPREGLFDYLQCCTVTCRKSGFTVQYQSRVEIPAYLYRQP